MSVEVSASLDGRPLPRMAWRGGFGDKAVYKASQLVTVFYKQNGKLNLLQYKKLGVSGNQSQPAEQAGPMEFTGHRGPVLHRDFYSRRHRPLSVALDAGTTITVDNQPATEPEAEMAVGTRRRAR